ncbi:MAG: hypothetical protein COT81_00345 [Candidatus Buchananbacteria bacterium CG10_big_fil_rev_8_21_14_0_10_42_9]|uniref:Uncharacterized protein n=1 Tax=Candidatus Buchananbacteria bacterium CG10_big_fil_rev_8_21_14_0_10_42_9 TaxID=1974526 RepID=A0A2H0W2M9_9BACT|nr:MAG: hypothetical protein COT81_00345 [Candidatus Buchananbacteria bacterium CG10_big_fil_rev_8_21_14_0_10_42_9]
MRFIIKKSKSQQGAVLVMTMIFVTVFVVIAAGILSLVTYQQRLERLKKAQAAALHIAEAGANYYRWHLAHDPTDYYDGNTPTACDPTCGPYVHTYSDPNNDIVGEFILEITPPTSGSTIVTIKSTGHIPEVPGSARSIAVRYGAQSWAKFAVAVNNDVRFGEGTVINGPVHSNGGVRFDGVANNVVTSAKADYNDPDHSGGNEFGVHTHVDPTDPLPPASVPVRADVFAGGREFPVAPVDFNGITLDLAVLEDVAGLVISKSNQQGWHVQFLGNGQIQYRKVKTTTSCYSSSQFGWEGTGLITSYVGNWTTASIPSNGVIFVKDNVWVDGTINAQSVTLVAAEDPLASGDANIWINNDLTYTNYDGSDIIGLIAQNDISVGLYSEDDLRIDGALIAQKGKIGRKYYASSCSSSDYIRDTITTFGSLVSYERYGFAWDCGYHCSGYINRNLQFDNNLIYNPPPSFPTTGDFEFISWEEVLPGESY